MAWASNINECIDPSDYAYCTCEVYSCGYSQPNRRNISIQRLLDGTAETDCSAGVSWWLYMGGYIPDNPWFSTYTELEYLQEHGFEILNDNVIELQRNDVLWRSGHTALYIGSGLMAEISISEKGDAGYDGTTAGDQTGHESHVITHGGYWEKVLRKKWSQPMSEFKFLVRPDGQNGYCYVDGSYVHPLSNPDEMEALQECYRRTHDGEEMPIFDYGSEKYPWAMRLFDALNRKL